jgi:D-tyrosyl-tRNA(Tyr) deacylase
MASVCEGGQVIASIGQGLVGFLGINPFDKKENIAYLIERLLHLRVFSDEKGKFHFNVQDIAAEILVISQFTLYANYTKGRRPSFELAAASDQAKLLYDEFLHQLKKQYEKVESGRFQSAMMIDMCQDGPVSILLESPL